MPKRRAPFKRNAPRFRAQPTVLVLCEDSKSGKDYLNQVKLHFRAQVHVRITHCGNTDPVGIISEAVRQARNFDRVFCAIDRDEHQNFNRALEIAAQHSNVVVIASFPCFEYWLLLHFRYTRKPYARAGERSPADCLINDLKRCDGMENYEKGSDRDLFSSFSARQFADARMRAATALADALECHEFNPSTKLHELVAVIERLGAPLPVDSEF